MRRATLEYQKREIVELYESGLTMKQVGEKTGKSKSTVQTVLHNAGYNSSNALITKSLSKQSPAEEQITSKSLEIMRAAYVQNGAKEASRRFFKMIDGSRVFIGPKTIRGVAKRQGWVNPQEMAKDVSNAILRERIIELCDMIWPPDEARKIAQREHAQGLLKKWAEVS